MERKSNPTKYEKQSRERMALIISKYCGGSQQELSNRTGIGKSSISQYVNGKNIPSNLTAAKLCAPFRLNPAWLMGFDVPMELAYVPDSMLSIGEQTLINDYRTLNEEGQEKVRDYAADLVAGKRYIKSDPDSVVDEDA